MFLENNEQNCQKSAGGCVYSNGTVDWKQQN